MFEHYLSNNNNRTMGILSIVYCYCLANNVQNAYCSIVIVCQTMLKQVILFYCYCLTNNAQNAYSIVIV